MLPTDDVERRGVGVRLTGRCYCGEIRYEAVGAPMLRAQCYCRECQYITGGAPNNFLAMPANGFRFTAGTPKTFRRADLPDAVTRLFCPTCGTHLATRPTGWPAVIVKVGTLDEPAAFAPDLAIHTADKQPFHHVAPGLPQHATRPG